MSRSLPAAAHRAAHRPPMPGSRFDAMTILVVPLQYPFAGTSRSRHRTPFTLPPASANRASPTSPQSDHRAQQQRSIRGPNRLSALSDPKKTVSRQTHCRPKSPLDSQVPSAFPRVLSSVAFVRRPPYLGSITHARPASETLPARRRLHQRQHPL